MRQFLSFSNMAIGNQSFEGVSTKQRFIERETRQDSKHLRQFHGIFYYILNCFRDVVQVSLFSDLVHEEIEDLIL